MYWFEKNHWWPPDRLDKLALIWPDSDGTSVQIVLALKDERYIETNEW